MSAVADTAGVLMQQMGPIHDFGAFIDSWHEFYLMTGTAAVTLAGLLFVALSLHLEMLVEERYSAMLVVARSTLASFVTVLVVSLTLLAPELSMRLTGVMLVTFVGVFTLVSFRQMGNALKDHHEDFPRQLLRRRLLAPIAGNLIMLLVGLALLAGLPEMLFLMISVMCLLLVNAIWSSWDLLVRIAQAKRRLAKAEAGGAR